MTKLRLIAAAVLQATTAFAEPGSSVKNWKGDTRDHLEPDQSVFEAHNGYYTLLVSALEEGFSEDVKARVLVVPSFSPEFLIGLRHKQGSYEIISLRPEFNLWYSYGSALYSAVAPGSDWSSYLAASNREAEDDVPDHPRREVPTNYKDVKINRCVIKIDDRIAERILDAWDVVLRETRYFDEKDGIVGSDGTAYHFWRHAFSTNRAGQIWEPSARLKPGKLALIAQEMEDYCSAPNEQTRSNSLRELNDRLEDLTK